MTTTTITPSITQTQYELPTDEFNALPKLQELNNTKVGATRLISFVIPVMNEENTLFTLCEQISQNIPAGCDYEIILIDDGSTDSSWAQIESLTDLYRGHVRGIRFRHNVGKASGLTAGFRATRGDVVFTMDADLQDDPKEVPRFIEKLDEGYGLVSGWKKKRHDPWHKVLPSRVFNKMLSRVSGVQLHDHNCGFKCYRGELARSMRLHGELHRMVPSLAGISGYEVTEIVVEHHPRRFGVSKYGIERFIRGFSDMLTIGFLRKYAQRPAHLTNAIAFGFLAAASGAAGISVTCGHAMMGLVAAVLMIAMAAGMWVAGLLAELVIRGGLKEQWSLPIEFDSATDRHQKTPMHGTAAPSVSLSYA